MASYFTNYLIDALFDLLLRDSVNAPFTGASAPATIYLSAWTVRPAADGTGGTEATGGGYARAAITTTSGAAFGAPATSGANRQTKNIEEFAHAAATGAWGGPVVAFAFHLSNTGVTDMFYVCDLLSSQTLANGVTLAYPVGNVVIDQNNS